MILDAVDCLRRHKPFLTSDMAEMLLDSYLSTDHTAGRPGAGSESLTVREKEIVQMIAEGKKFLEGNANKPGVIRTESGLQYEIVEPGTGRTPSPTDKVTVNYRGTQVNGEEFDSSYSRGKPATFQLNGVIKGWTEGLQLIKEGGKIKLFIPSELAYGGRGPLAHRTLIFDVELISVGAEPEKAEAVELAHPKAGQ